MRTFAALSLCALAACGPGPSAQVTKNRPTDPTAVTFPPLHSLDAAVGSRSNAEIALDMMDLTFNMENGRTLAVFSRFEGPVSIGLAGDVPPSAARDLATLVARLQREAGLPVTLAPPDQPASITIEFAPKAVLRRYAPTAACFVVPNISSLAEYKRLRGSAAVDWAEVERRSSAVIFVPSDTSPQEIRDCLHEEVAQALGPLNDLYRLPDSVFNDDNFNTVLTGFDMLVLRAYYSPQLASGMSRDQAARIIPQIIAALNPGGAGMGSARAGPTPKAWTAAIESALGRQGNVVARRSAAEQALAIAQSQGWADNRLAFSHFAVARLSAGSDAARAVAEFSAAAAIYTRQPGGEVHVAHIEMQLAAMALASANATEVIRLTGHAIPIVQRHENAALLATLMLIRAEALDQLGDTQGAAALRLDSQPWARYGFGTDAVVKARMRDIATVADRGSSG